MRRLVEEERGVSAIVSAVSLVALVAALMLSLDAGNLWQTRRAMITATDSAALEAARTAAISGTSVACGSYTATLAANAGSDVQPEGCTVVRGPTAASGYVVVQGRKPSAVRFGGVLGIGQQTAFSMSAARWGLLTQVEGLRPIGVCLQNTHVQGYLGLGPDIGTHPSAGVHRIWYTKDQPLACGGAPGNWGFLDFDGGSNSNADLVDWLLTGYDEPVGVRDCNGDGNLGDLCPGDTGSSGGSTAAALSSLQQSGEPFSIVVFDTVSGNGAGARFDVFAFLGVKLRGFRVTGTESQRYLDFEFTKITVTGNCCSAVGLDSGVRGVALCAVDHDSRLIAARCS